VARYFFDTSALVKHYHTELGSPKVDLILGESTSEYLVARLTLAEAPSVFAKKVRTGEIADVDFDQLRLRFFADVKNRTLTPVRILNAHFESAGDLIAKHGKTRQIYTLDALQLAVALSVQQPTPIDHFVCADQRLCAIAALEGLAVINPELTP
jgi:predicted nucleic acid-binding protein